MRLLNLIKSYMNQIKRINVPIKKYQIPLEFLKSHDSEFKMIKTSCCMQLLKNNPSTHTHIPTHTTLKNAELETVNNELRVIYARKMTQNSNQCYKEKVSHIA